MADAPSQSAVAAEGPVFAPITYNDHGGILVIVATLLMTGTLMGLGIRVHVRMSVTKGLGVDDYVATAASVLAVGQTVATLVSVNRGFGKVMDLIQDQTDRISQIEKAMYASDILFILAVTLSKCAVCLLVKRLTQTKKHQVVAYAVLAFSATWGLVSMLALTLRVPMNRPWQLIGTDFSKLLLRWQVIGSFDVGTEVAMSLLPIVVVWKLQMPLKLKLLVVISFSFRLMVIAAIIARIVYFESAINDRSSDIFFSLVPTTLCAQIQLHWALMAATIPCLKPFMRAANTGYLGFGGTFVQRTQKSYALSSLKSKSRSANNDSVLARDEDQQDSNRDNHGGQNVPGFVRAGGTTWTSIVASKRAKRLNQSPDNAVQPSDDHGSVSTDGSEVGIIHQTTSWLVEYHENPEDQGITRGSSDKSKN